MKIDYAIMGSNTDVKYLDFWPIVSKAWNQIFGITPILGLICDEDTDLIKDEFGYIKKIKRVNNIDDGLQSQIIRFFLIKELTGNVILTDIDMLPISKNYFINQVKEWDSSKFYILSSDNEECNKDNQIPMCYNVANSKLFSEILEVDQDFEVFATKLHSLNYGWTTDQRYLWEKVNSYESKMLDNVVKLNRGWSPMADKRIDRLNWIYDEALFNKDYYIDSHLLRPYNQYKQEIDSLVNLLFKNS